MVSRLNRTAVVRARKQVYDKEYIEELKRQAQASVASITKKPTIQELLAYVDQCWNNPVIVRQLQFKNKDQHYAYITEYYHAQVEPLSLEEYRKLVLTDILGRLEKAANLLDSDKILAAAKEHKKQEEEHLKNYEDQIAELKDRNKKMTDEILKEIHKDNHD